MMSVARGVEGSRKRPLSSRWAVPATALLLASVCGCATTSDLGRIERLPEGTLPPSKEVGPAVNIQPAPLAREDYWPYLRGGYGPCYGPFFCGPGWGGASLYYGVGRGGAGWGGVGFGLNFGLF
jgi:hypothetical protein